MPCVDNILHQVISFAKSALLRIVLSMFLSNLVVTTSQIHISVPHSEISLNQQELFHTSCGFYSYQDNIIAKKDIYEELFYASGEFFAYWDKISA